MTSTPSRFRLFNTPLNSETLEGRLLRDLCAIRPGAIGLAIAYVSVYGASFLRKMATRASTKQIRLVADTRDAITHPAALEAGLKAGWEVRTVNSERGTFHPKFIVCGDAFETDGGIRSPRWMLVGSGNLSKGGLTANFETSLIRESDAPIQRASVIYKELWALGADLTPAGLVQYNDYFAARNKQRPPEDMYTLGVADDPPDPPETDTGVVREKKVPAPEQQSMPVTAASAAWAGLESFTGEYTLQVEFPRDAGVALQRMIGASGSGTHVQLRCEDGVVRPMRYAFYPDNSMFRLNVPNEVPGSKWARDHKKGLAYVDRDATRRTEACHFGLCSREHS